MRGTRSLSVTWMPFALEHAMSSICRTQLLSSSSVQCYSSVSNYSGKWRPHMARCWLAPTRAPHDFGRCQQSLLCRPRHQQRYIKKHASASTLMLEQEQKFKEDQRRELTSVNTGVSPKLFILCSNLLLYAVTCTELALAANSLIFVAKSAAWFVSGGSSLLAEAIHSLADIGNQAMLRVGITYAAQAPTAQYPFGHMRDKFIFSLISAVGIFCLGAGVSIVHGLHAIASPAAHADNMWGIAALIFSTVVEGATLLVAVRAVAAGAKSAGLGFLEYIKSGRDPVSVAIMAEDGAAVAGVIVAAACTMLADYTGMLMWDGIGSILVGLILGGVAVYLIQRNRSFLIGRSMNPDDFKKIVRHIKQDPVVKNVYEAKSEEIGEGIFRVSAEVDFHGPNLLERYMSTKDVRHMQHQFSNAVQGPDTQEFENIMKAYGSEVVGLVGAQIDRIEAEVMQLVPGVMYVDLETDRGRFSSYSKATKSFDEVEDIRLETFRGNRQAPGSAAERDMMRSVLVGDLDAEAVRNGTNGAASGQSSSILHPASENFSGKVANSDTESGPSVSNGESPNDVETASKSGAGIGSGGKS